jgi:hypothetical protein
MLARRQELNTVANQRPQPGARFSRLGPTRLGYIDRWSLALDFKILLRTIPAVILGLGAVLYNRATDFRLYRGSILRCVARKHPLDVLGQNVELDIHQIAGLQNIDIRVPFGVGNYPDCETFWEKFRDCQTDSVDGDGAFVGRVMSEIRRQIDFEAMIRAAAFKGNYFRAAIDVALDEVAA